MAIATEYSLREKSRNFNLSKLHIPENPLREFPITSLIRENCVASIATSRISRNFPEKPLRGILEFLEFLGKAGKSPKRDLIEGNTIALMAETIRLKDGALRPPRRKGVHLPP